MCLDFGREVFSTRARRQPEWGGSSKIRSMGCLRVLGGPGQTMHKCLSTVESTDFLAKPVEKIINGDHIIAIGFKCELVPKCSNCNHVTMGRQVHHLEVLYLQHPFQGHPNFKLSLSDQSQVKD